MRSDAARSLRIDGLYKKAKTGKYTWKDLKRMARALGVSEPTVKSYLDDVEARLIKGGFLK